MVVDISWHHELAPAGFRRAVTRFKPRVDDVRLAGVPRQQVIMALETVELRRSRYDRHKTQAEWLYFTPQNARQFAEVLMAAADAADSVPGNQEKLGVERNA